MENGMCTHTIPLVPVIFHRGRMGVGIEVSVEQGGLWIAKSKCWVGKGCFVAYILGIWTLRAGGECGFWLGGSRFCESTGGVGAHV